MYQIEQGRWFVPNPLNQFTVSPRNNLIHNPGGSLTLSFQNESPGKTQEANWVPAKASSTVLVPRRGGLEHRSRR